MIPGSRKIVRSLLTTAVIAGMVFSGTAHAQSTGTTTQGTTTGATMPTTTTSIPMPNLSSSGGLIGGLLGGSGSTTGTPMPNLSSGGGGLGGLMGGLFGGSGGSGGTTTPNMGGGGLGGLMGGLFGGSGGSGSTTGTTTPNMGGGGLGGLIGGLFGGSGGSGATGTTTPNLGGGIGGMIGSLLGGSGGGAAGAAAGAAGAAGAAASNVKPLDTSSVTNGGALGCGAMPGCTGHCGPACGIPECAAQLSSVCSAGCVKTSEQQSKITKDFITNEFTFHRQWMVEVFFEKHILPALMLFAEQISATAMGQVVSVGMFLDAKHQLETQRLFQQMMAEAHKDYHPSEGLCTFGTNVRSLAASDRNTDLTAMAISNRTLQRELLSGDAVAGAGQTSDYLSRVAQFRELYCDKADNGNGLSLLCPNASKDDGRKNNDINYTAVLETPLTLDIDFTEEGDSDHSANKHKQEVSKDEEDVFALAANLYAHNVAPIIPRTFLSDEQGVANPQGVNHYMNIRSIAAKRSVARNSFAAVASMKSQGEKEVQPYLYAIMREMGIEEKEIPLYLGKRPSYYAQMEILTKKLYQNPTFYTELYDKPANVERKIVSMQAIDLMQRRDIYRSVLRSEAVMAVMLETALTEQHEKIANEMDRMPSDTKLIELPATQ
ncbi:MAG TPA: hypothetical protein VFS88_08680 [Micavibrio sp.]|nr:hypothetical protein [Micavibrio sp.]